MSFFAAFSSLGYSAIVLFVTAVFVALLAFNSLGMATRPLWLRIAFLAIFAAAFVPATIYLAQERVKVMDGFRDDGGPKPRLPPTP